MKSFSLVFFLILISKIVGAQTPSNFTGDWVLDKTKSKLNEPQASFPGTKIMHLRQNSSMIIWGETYVQPGSENFNTLDDTIKLDGKVKISNEYGGISKTSAIWSRDKKNLTRKTVYTSTSDPSDSVSSSMTFILSEDKRTLAMEISGKNKVTELKSTEVYYKK
jgi:hypothetical protein